MILEAFEPAGLTPGTRRGPRAGRGQHPLLPTTAAIIWPRDRQRHLHRRTRWSTLLERWVEQYPILSIEDGMAEDDWDGWRC